MKKRTFLMALALLAAVLVGTTGTLAYLSDTDEDVNVMTLGNVAISQLEFERVVENDAWVSLGETDPYGFVPDKVQPFTQLKPLYPAYFADGALKWDDRPIMQRAATEHQQSWGQIVSKAGNAAPGFNQLYDDSVRGVIDKFVFVENEGTSDAYVRTWFAFEQGGVAAADFPNVIIINANEERWNWETVATDVEIHGNTYVVRVATYLGAEGDPTGVLAGGALTTPSLLQLFMHPDATNDQVTAIDGNDNGTYDVLVVTQAVQAVNFPDGKTALDAAFGPADPDSIPFDTTDVPNIIYTVAQLRTATRAGGSYILGADLLIEDVIGSGFGTYVSADFKLDLNGHDIEMAVPGTHYALFYLSGGGLEITGEGDVFLSDGYANLVWATNTSTVNLYGGNWFETSDDLVADKKPCEGIYGNKTSQINIYGGTYSWDCNPESVVNIKNGGGSDIDIYGGSFLAPPTFVDGVNDASFLAPGFKLSESTDDQNRVWQNVVPQ